MSKRGRDVSELQKKYMNEPKVKVFGSEVFKPSSGDVYTYTLNGFPVSIKFDGTWQEFPESVAENLQARLEAMAKSNNSKEVSVRIG